jgi:7-cyano-7-deazaguanine synthase
MHRCANRPAFTGVPRGPLTPIQLLAAPLNSTRFAFNARARRNTTTISAAAAAAAVLDVVLLSGGVESSTLLQHLARTSSRALQPLHVTYAQRAAPAEHAACLLQVAHAQRAAGAPIADLVTLDLTDAGEALRALTPRRRAHIPVPHRNLPLLSLAVSAAAALRVEADVGVAQASSLYIALSADDAAWYPSADAGFLASFRGLVAGLEPGLRVSAPFAEIGKAGVVAEGEAASVVWADTYSCMIGVVDADGRLVHCGRCGQCRARRAAFAEAGVPDGAHGVYRR